MAMLYRPLQTEKTKVWHMVGESDSDDWKHIACDSEVCKHETAQGAEICPKAARHMEPGLATEMYEIQFGHVKTGDLFVFEEHVFVKTGNTTARFDQDGAGDHTFVLHQIVEMKKAVVEERRGQPVILDEGRPFDGEEGIPKIDIQVESEEIDCPYRRFYMSSQGSLVFLEMRHVPLDKLFWFDGNWYSHDSCGMGKTIDGEVKNLGPETTVVGIRRQYYIDWGLPPGLDVKAPDWHLDDPSLFGGPSSQEVEAELRDNMDEMKNRTCKATYSEEETPDLEAIKGAAEEAGNLTDVPEFRCPKCGESKNLAQERRIGGDTHCGNCKFSGKSALFFYTNGYEDEMVRRWWRCKGGSQHGPNIETWTMPEVSAMPAIRELLVCQSTLMTLVALRDLKDKEGETDCYQIQEPLAWEAARRALGLWGS